MEEQNNVEPVQPIYKTFEEALPIINKILNARRSRWTLKSVASMDFDDVCQLCRLHLWKKWDQYDPTQKLEPWVSRIITRQMMNLVRNVYSSFSRPCLKCAENQGGDLCGIFGHQTNSCPLFATWEQTKKRAYNVKLAVSAENHQQEISEMPDTSVNTERAVQVIFEHLKSVLKANEIRVFELIYIKHLSDEEVAKEMNYCASENRPSKNYSQRKPGYARIAQIKRVILAKVKEMRNEIDIF